MRDVAAVIAVAILVIIAIATAKWRIRPSDVQGFWRHVSDGEPTGGEYVVAASTRGGAPGLTAVGRRGTSPAESAQFPAAVALTGRVGWLRRVCFKNAQGGADEACGRMDLAGRHIDWGGGERWAREGVNTACTTHCVGGT